MLRAALIGNLGGDPELKYSQNGNPLLRFNVASNGRVRTPEGEWQDETTWVRVTVFGQRAETLSQYLTKGTKVYVEGRLEARPWTDQQGNLRSGLEVTASEVEFMTARQEGGGESEPRQARRPAQQQARPATPAQDEDLEDLPF
jgi:single-strand DNA-binding protein